MSVVFIANIRIHDEAEYQEYVKETDAIFSQYNGQYLSVDKNPVVLEGQWDYSRVVLIQFPDKDSLYTWYYSKEYQRILQHRLHSAACDTIVVELNC